MSLPKLNTPTFELELPISKQSVTYRPFLVKEEKLLLIAAESGEEKDLMRAVKEIITACTLTEIDVNNLPSFEVEYLFLNIRGKSVGEQIDFKYKHSGDVNKAGEECLHEQDVSVNLDSVKLNITDNHTNKINITDDIGIIFNYPSFDVVEKISTKETEVEKIYSLMMECVKCIWDADDTYEDFSKKELEEFFDGMTKDQFEKISDFFNTMPKLAHTIEYACGGCGEETTVEIEGLQSFFT